MNYYPLTCANDNNPNNDDNNHMNDIDRRNDEYE